MCLKIKRAESSDKLPALFTTGGCPPKHEIYMICFVRVVLKDIFEQGKDYSWQRPGICPECNNYKLHGHGFAARYFQGFASCLYLKCYRCPGCHIVITLRPDSHFSRIRSSKEEIRSHLSHRLRECRWPGSLLSRSSLRHWLANLTKQILAHLGKDWGAGPMAAFDRLLAAGVTPVSRVI